MSCSALSTTASRQIADIAGSKSVAYICDIRLSSMVKDPPQMSAGFNFQPVTVSSPSGEWGAVAAVPAA